MMYAEFVRVRRVVRNTAIVLTAGIILVYAVAMTVTQHTTHRVMDVVQAAQVDPSSHVTTSVLPNGSKRTLVDNAKQGVAIVIDDVGPGRRHIVLTEKNSSRNPTSVDMSDVRIKQHRTPQGLVSEIDTGVPANVTTFVELSTLVALIVATVLGAPFARENNGHLEVAFTKPVSRERNALGIIAVDLAGLAAIWLFAGALHVVMHFIVHATNVAWGETDLGHILVGIAVVVAWYALLICATASMKRAYGTVIGLAWPVALLVAVLAKTSLGDSAIAQTLHTVATPLSWLDPLAYLAGTQPAQGVFFTTSMLLLLALVYIALAIVQWRRVEA